MGQIRQTYPALLDNAPTVAGIVADQRNLVLKVNKCFPRARWGYACMAYDVTLGHFQQLVEDGTYPWLAFIPEIGKGYAIQIEGVPLRIQKDDPEIRNVLDGERAAMRQMCLRLPGSAAAGTVLRLEITQPRGQPVETIALVLYEEDSGVALDSEVVYRRPAASTGTNDLPSTGPSPTGATVLPFVRPAQDADPKTRYRFNDPDAAMDDDGDDDE